MTLLSILIPSIPSRAETFVPLWVEINRQAEWVNTIHMGAGTVEVIIDDSPAFLDGGLSIDLSKIGDEILNVYEVLDERKDRGEYYHHE